MDELIAGPDQRRQAEENTYKLLTGQPLRGTSERRRGDGSDINVEFHGVPVIIDNQVVGAYVFYWDATELARAREEIKEKEALYRTLFESAGKPSLSSKGPTLWNATIGPWKCSDIPVMK